MTNALLPLEERQSYGGEWPVMPRWMWLSGLVALAGIADVATTVYGLAYVPGVYETNWVAALTIEWLGYAGLALFKAVVVWLVACMMAWLDTLMTEGRRTQTERQYLYWCQWASAAVLCGVWGFAAVHNLLLFY